MIIFIYPQNFNIFNNSLEKKINSNFSEYEIDLGNINNSNDGTVNTIDSNYISYSDINSN